MRLYIYIYININIYICSTHTDTQTHSHTWCVWLSTYPNNFCGSRYIYTRNSTDISTQIPRRGSGRCRAPQHFAHIFYTHTHTHTRTHRHTQPRQLALERTTTVGRRRIPWAVGILSRAHRPHALLRLGARHWSTPLLPPPLRPLNPSVWPRR
jgi:hypothetical protein